MNALDRSHITFVGLNLEPTVFDEFECTTPLELCIDTSEFMQVLKRIKKGELLRLEEDEGNIIITFLGESTRRFRIKLIDLDYDSPTPPALNPPCSINIMSNLLKDCLVDMELFGDVINYRVDEEYFYAETNGEFGDSEFKYLHGELVNESVSSSFSIEKLKDILSASKFSETVEILLGNDMPLLLKFELDTGDGELKYLLAPRLSADEE